MQISHRSVGDRPDTSGETDSNALSGFHASLLEVLPHAAIYVTREGNILLHNKRMAAACSLGGLADVPRSLPQLFSDTSWKRCETVLSAAFGGVPAQASGLVTLRSGTNFCHHLICTSFVSLAGEHQAVLMQFEMQAGTHTEASAEVWSGAGKIAGKGMADDASVLAAPRLGLPASGLLEHFPDDVVVFEGSESLDHKVRMLMNAVGGDLDLDALTEAVETAGDSLPQTFYVPEDGDFQTAAYLTGRRMCEVRLVPLSLPDQDAAARTPSMAIIRRKVDCPHEIAENKRLAYLDPLTGLENRRAFTRSLKRELDRLSSDPETGLAIIYIDLDEFKKVNDLGGHDTGDDMLLRVAASLLLMLGEFGTAARIGGDEFAGMIPVADERAALQIAESILDALDRIRLEVAERVFTISGSIGVTFVGGGPHSGKFDAANLLILADRACLRGKRGGGRSVHVHVVEAGDCAPAEGEVAGWPEPSSFRGTELSLFAMPIVDLGKDTICGEDVLLRLQGERMPGLTSRAWLSAVQRGGFIAQVDTWTLDRILDVAEGMKDRTTLFTSVSADSARNPNFRDALFNRLTANPLLASRLCLEIAEKDYLREPETVERFFDFASELGCQTAIDDFAGHWPVLSRLTDVRVEWLKLEAGLTQQVVEEPAKAAILGGLVRAAHELGIKVMAKHVEQAEEAAALRDLGVEAALGYHFGRPKSWPRPQDAN